jgi:hypothetical protein
MQILQPWHADIKKLNHKAVHIYTSYSLCDLCVLCGKCF